MGRCLLALAVVTLMGCADGSPVSDGSGPYPDVTLEITYEYPEVDPFTYSVTCQDDRALVEGAELDAEAACTALSDLEVASRLVDGPPDQACPEIYGGPDVATVVGTIDGEPVDTEIDRTDGCGVSDWDNLLGDLLPPARGVEEGG